MTKAAAWSRERLLTELERLALRASGRGTFFDEAAARLKRAVAFDGACWHTLDPGSDLIVQHHLQDLSDRFPVLARNEYGVGDFNKFADLARRSRKAATLSAATAGEPERSARFRDLLSPAGLAQELRAAFAADGACWGALILVRRAGQPEFSEREVDLLADCSTLFARAVRRGLVAEACTSTSGEDAPGMVEFDASGEVTQISASAEPLLAELSGATVEAGVRAPSIHAVSSATKAALGHAGEPGALPRATVRTPAGTWLVLHGGVVRGLDRDAHVVFVQRAHPMLVAPLLLRAYGLTAREREVTQLLLRGATTAQIAATLGISPHTVNDHTKAVFDKAGARTRGELSATLFFGEHLPRIQRGVAIGDDASFIDAPRPRGEPL
jgi:DNA-binding CsgD family transcriptional regulator